MINYLKTRPHKDTETVEWQLQRIQWKGNQINTLQSIE